MLNHHEQVIEGTMSNVFILTAEWLENTKAGLFRYQRSDASMVINARPMI